jgi:hypothetical protein
MRTSSTSLLVIACALGFATTAHAQRTVQYDTLSEESPAAISCGFCAGEKFGMVFRPLDSGGGLRPEEFPLTINNVQVAVASATLEFGAGGLQCVGSTAGGMVAMTIEIYAGTTAPRSAIRTNPATGPWTGETMLFSESAELTLSTETSAGTNMYNVMFTTVPVDVMVPAPNTYVRVVVSIPAGGSSASCELLGFGAPGALGIRDDDGRIEPNIGFIYSVGGGVGDGWIWNEAVEDPTTGSTGINGEWAIRLDVQPAATPRDAGTSTPDGGTGTDAGSTSDIDASTGVDGGTSSECTVDAECAGGERCSSGACVRVACTAASDCAGGMTCVAGMCRGLCTSNAECRGGEVCDMAAGYCTPVGGEDEGGCSCRAAGAGRGHATGAVLVAMSALLALARRPRRR